VDGDRGFVVVRAELSEQKAQNRSKMWHAGLPVPPGFCVTWDAMERHDIPGLDSALATQEANTFAVRSSAVEGDGMHTSFAGILVSRLKLGSSEVIRRALDDIRESAVAPELRNEGTVPSVPAFLTLALQSRS